MSFTLYTQPGAFRAMKVLIAAEYNGIEVNVPEFSAADASSPEFLAKNPLGKLPMLETPTGQTVTQSNAIARYVARMRRDTELYGVSFHDSASIDSWIDFSAHEIELPATVLWYPAVGYMQANEAAQAKAQEDLARALRTVESHLLTRTYLVGDSITLADITVASALLYPFKLVCDGSFRGQFPCVMRWFETCVNQPQFAAVMGQVTLCAGGAAPAAAGGKKSKGKKNKGGNAPAPAAAAAPAPAPAPAAKKPKHPLVIMDQESPSPMSQDTWKKAYSNCGGNYQAACDQFWEMFDAEGYSVFHATYNYNAENTKVFMVANAISGFLQRCDEIRRWTFGVMLATGDEQNMPIEVSGMWVLRGQTAEHMVNANPDAEYHTWTKVDTSDPAARALVNSYFMADDQLDGKVICDCKVFK